MAVPPCLFTFRAYSFFYTAGIIFYEYAYKPKTANVTYGSEDEGRGLVIVGGGAREGPTEGSK